MKQITLTKGYVTLVDDADYDWLSQCKWFCQLDSSGHAAAVRNIGKSPHQSKVFMHRAILQAGATEIVDHINSNSLDNQRSNLRICTRAQNQHNRKPNRNTATGIKGVTWHGEKGMWRARIGVHGKRIHLGYFPTPIDAGHAYDEAARTYHGKFARPNFPLQ